MGIMSDPAGRDDQSRPGFPPYPSKDHHFEEDDGTLYRDDESYTSGESESEFSDDSRIYPRPATWKEHLPAFRVDKADGQKEVFECWKLFIVPDRKKLFGGTKFLGITVQEFDNLRGSVSAVSQAKTQSELADMYRGAIARHESKNRRSWPSRIVRGTAESYKQDLEKRCGKLAPQLKDSIRDLLWEREYASSTARHERKWTVVSMEERWIHRFTRTEGAKVDRHKVRFWKNPKTQQMTECFVVIRGGESGTPDAKTGYTRPDVSSNPWVDVDIRENGRMMRQEECRSRAERTRRRARSVSRSRDRSRRGWAEPYAVPSRDHRRSMRDRSCDSDEDDNFSFGESDFGPPESEFRSQPRFCPPIPRINRCFPRVPSPPGSFPPPPPVAAFHRQGQIPPPPPPPFPAPPRFYRQGPMAPPPPPPPPPVDWRILPALDNPFIPRASNNVFSGYCPPWALNGIAPPPPPTEFGMGYNLATMPSAPPPPPPPQPQVGRHKSLCQPCKATPNCPHFPETMCYRPIRYAPETRIGSAHFDCLDCDEGPPIWRRRAARCDDADDTATVLDDDDLASELNGDGNNNHSKLVEVNKDDEDTQVEELAEMPAADEDKEA